MAKFKTFFDVYRDTFFSHFEKLMKGETIKMQSDRFRVWTQTTSAFFQRKQKKKVKFGQIFMDILFTMQSKCKFQKAFH